MSKRSQAMGLDGVGTAAKGPLVIEPADRRRFGAELRRLRQERKLSQQALAERSDLAVDTVRRIEAGGFSPSLETVSRLAMGLEISLFTLFARLDGRQFGEAAALFDYLCERSDRQIRVARRILEALFDPGPEDESRA